MDDERIPSIPQLLICLPMYLQKHLGKNGPFLEHCFQLSQSSVPRELHIQRMASQLHVQECTGIASLAILMAGKVIQMHSLHNDHQKGNYLFKALFLWFAAVQGWPGAVCQMCPFGQAPSKWSAASLGTCTRCAHLDRHMVSCPWLSPEDGKQCI